MSVAVALLSARRMLYRPGLALVQSSALNLPGPARSGTIPNRRDDNGDALWSGTRGRRSDWC